MSATNNTYRIFYLTFFILLSGCASKQALKEDEERLSAFLNEHQAEVDQCFETSSSSAEQQEIRLGAQHQKTGDFTSIEILSGDPIAGRCVSQKLENWSSTPPNISGPVELNWTYNRSAAQAFVARDLRPFQSDFDRCFEEAQSRNPDILGGLLRLQIRIDQSGGVEKIQELTGFRGSSGILNCISERSKSWSFSSEESPSTQVWTWNFRKQL